MIEMVGQMCVNNGATHLALMEPVLKILDLKIPIPKILLEIVSQKAPAILLILVIVVDSTGGAR